VTLHFLSGFRVKKKETRADWRDITNHAPLPIPSRRKPRSPLGALFDAEAISTGNINISPKVKKTTESRTNRD
jgi:hypothetical protein